ncbi:MULTISPECIES: hypothetical protein [unclassified Frigoribacterium]|uniref:hypothetical protein n=1 Tax=unclassified Frigoribacterium TaxID=2627005 RepID=UPI0006FCAD61|nr:MULTISPECIES: hypothetical protein [unclassified Frigoribacterium]KQO47822.1 hypothetical protein ASF07_10370 [Frigoribacterium sp. Leaf254]KQT39915.1 hypothetical protein ASG28_10375 [Frigoribacterium sp. Leaf415]
MIARNSRWTGAALAAALATVLGVTGALPAAAAPPGPAAAPSGTAAPTAPTAAPAAAPAVAPLTNLAHLDFLLDRTTPVPEAGHSTYRQSTEPTLTLPWTYADARDGGTFARVGGGPLDPATGYWGQGAFNSDDVSRTAVVYLRDWQQTGSESSRQKAYELLRATAYFQTTTGEDAGNVVLWMQPDGTFNQSPVPVELPDPSDSGNSYWLARSIWAFGEGYAAFADEDPEFAAFLQQRLQLGVTALNRETLARYGQYDVADGAKVPAWLIGSGADASAEAVLGLSAYSAVVPGDAASRTALTQLAEGVAAMSSGDGQTWPYGAVLPWAKSRSMWHAWSSQMPAALARASTTLARPDLLKPAVLDQTSFTTTLLTASGPDNAWYPTPVDQTQIAYGADSRLQSALAVAGAGAGAPGLKRIAAVAASWYFGTNRSGTPVYDPATGVTFDGVQADGTVNRNSGAESTIHGLLSMIALDGAPDVSAEAQGLTSVTSRDGLTVVEAETAASTTGTVVTPDSAWTGESQYGGGSALRLEPGQSATITVPAGSGLRHVEPVLLAAEGVRSTSVWKAGRVPLGTLTTQAGARGVTAASGALLPQTLPVPIGAGTTTITVTAGRAATVVDGLIVRPLVQRLVLAGTAADGRATTTELLSSTSRLPLPASVGVRGTRSSVSSYDAQGRLVQQRDVQGRSVIVVKPGGFAVLTR